MKRTVSAVIVAICISSVAAMAQVNSRGATAPRTPAKPAPAAAPAVEDYIIGSQDLLDVSVWDEPQFDIKVAVRPDGKIGVKLLGDVQAGGLTTKQVETRIAEGLKPYKPNAHVTVIVLEIHSKTVSITGNGVAHGGGYPLLSPMKVMDLLAKAGLNDFAKRNEIQIIRNEGSVVMKFPFNYDDFLKGNYAQNIQLRSDDLIIVP